MANKLLLKAAYVLHTRAYRDSSALLELFTPECGRIKAVARGIKRPKSPLKGLLQPFTPLLLTWYGKGTLVTLAKIEASGNYIWLTGKQLMAGLYLNELLTRLLEPFDPCANLFKTYETALIALASCEDPTSILRRFEINLLQEIGYGLQLDCTANGDEMVKADTFYRFHPQVGLIEQTNLLNNERFPIFSGENLLAIHHGNLDNKEILRDAKRISQLALNTLMNGKPIKSLLISDEAVYA